MFPPNVHRVEFLPGSRDASRRRPSIESARQQSVGPRELKTDQPPAADCGAVFEYAP